MWKSMINSLKKYSTALLITLISLFIVIVFLVVWWLFVVNAHSTAYQTSFSNYGTFLAGTLGVVLTAFNVFYLLHTWKKQKNVSERQEIESRFFNLLALRNEMRDEIRLDSNPHLHGNEALNHLAGLLKSEVNDLTRGIEERDNRVAALYAQNSELRHYLDMILFIVEFITNKEILTLAQKLEYINVLKANSSANEVFVWMLMRFDYEVVGFEEGFKEHIQKIKQVNKKNKLFRSFRIKV